MAASGQGPKGRHKDFLAGGLALYVAGVRDAPFPAWVRALALGAALALALASTLPRARRMRRAREEPCACAATRVFARGG